MAKENSNNRQKDIAKLLRDQGNKRGFGGGKAFTVRPTKILGLSSKGR